MPELPEVETVVRTLRPHAEGRFIVRALELRRPCLMGASMGLDEACGARISGIARRGKLVLMHLELVSGIRACLAVHLRMTGRLIAEEFADDALLMQQERTSLVKTDRHARAEILLADGPQAAPCARLCFSDARTFGRMLLGTPKIFDSWDFWRKMGPEPLDIAPDAFAMRLERRISVKTAMMDQSIIAGIGNIYADESLFAAGINPLRKACTLSEGERHRLHQCLCEILELSISQCGSSIRDYLDADGNVGAFQNFFAVYGRSGQKCIRCGNTLERTSVGGRTTVFCPECQKP